MPMPFLVGVLVPLGLVQQSSLVAKIRADAGSAAPSRDASHTRGSELSRLPKVVDVAVRPLARWKASAPSDDGEKTIASSARPPEPALPDGAARLQRRNVLVGVLFGCGIIAFVDEAVFHQLLHWHHFYDRSTPAVGLVSDGVFHAFSWFATVASLFLFADLRRRNALRGGHWLGGILVGVGAFQLFDGLVQHKLLGLHEIRYGVELLPYDLLWNGAAVAFLAAGFLVLLRARRRDGGLAHRADD
ncbi:DUF2243 domain-containing protein [Arthrobacter sp. NPDC092385]|uniref:DUF2243 domain-containing protein n=1 Tax=Arthrobacter sp. NPDC092385 TaxID=3363943 RepID=UPI0038237109